MLIFSFYLSSQHIQELPFALAVETLMDSSFASTNEIAFQQDKVSLVPLCVLFWPALIYIKFFVKSFLGFSTAHHNVLTKFQYYIVMDYSQI